MAITLRQMEIFIAVAESQQVTRASEKLGLTQSAVSMALGELQSQLGGPLFDRQGRRLLLNDRGRFLLPLGKDLLFQVHNIETLLTEQSGEIAGSLKIVASSTIGNYILPYLIGTFKQMHPAVYVDMGVCNTRCAETLIVEGNADVGFVEGEVSRDLIEVQPWFQDELVTVASPASKIGMQGKLRMPEDLAGTEWIMREKGSGTAQIFKKRLGEYATGLKVVMELGHTEAIKKAVEAGAGIACLSGLAVCREVEQGWLRRVSVRGIDLKRPFLIIHYRNKAMTHLMEEFIAFCKVFSECAHGCSCLASPWKIQELAARSTTREK